MKVYNIWKSTMTGEFYKMPLDWAPRFGGWEFIKTVEEMEE